MYLPPIFSLPPAFWLALVGLAVIAGLELIGD